MMMRSAVKPVGHGLAAVHWMWYGRLCMKRDEALCKAAEHEKGSRCRAIFARSAREWNHMAVRELIAAKASA